MSAPALVDVVRYTSVVITYRYRRSRRNIDNVVGVRPSLTTDTRRPSGAANPSVGNQADGSLSRRGIVDIAAAADPPTRYQSVGRRYHCRRR